MVTALIVTLLIGLVLVLLLTAAVKLVVGVVLLPFRLLGWLLLLPLLLLKGVVRVLRPRPAAL